MSAPAYLDVEVLVDLDYVPKEENILHQAGELPHVAQLLQRAWFLDGLFHLHLLVGALAGGHRQERAYGDASGDGLGGLAAYVSAR